MINARPCNEGKRGKFLSQLVRPGFPKFGVIYRDQTSHAVPHTAGKSDELSILTKERSELKNRKLTRRFFSLLSQIRIYVTVKNLIRIFHVRTMKYIPFDRCYCEANYSSRFLPLYLTLIPSRNGFRSIYLRKHSLGRTELSKVYSEEVNTSYYSKRIRLLTYINNCITTYTTI